MYNKYNRGAQRRMGYRIGDAPGRSQRDELRDCRAAVRRVTRRRAAQCSLPDALCRVHTAAASGRQTDSAIRATRGA